MSCKFQLKINDLIRKYTLHFLLEILFFSDELISIDNRKKLMNQINSIRKSYPQPRPLPVGSVAGVAVGNFHH